MSDASSTGDPPSVCLQTGSFTLTAGFAGDDSPSVTTPNLTAHERYIRNPRMLGTRMVEGTVCDDAQRLRGVASLKYPVERGVVVDWDGLEAVWNHIMYNKLRLGNCAESGISIDTNPWEPRSQLERKLQILFETYEFATVFPVNSTMLSMNASGRTTGVVLDCGHGSTQIMPYYEGYELSHLGMRLPLGGIDVSDQLQNLLNSRTGAPYVFRTSGDKEIVHETKRKCCRVQIDYDKAESGDCASVTCDLPGWERLDITREVYRAPEVLFQPNLAGLDCLGVAEAVHAVISRSDLDNRGELWNNVIVVGGASLTPGFPERLRKELIALAPGPLRESVEGPLRESVEGAGTGPGIRVHAAPERGIQSWIGLSILGSLTNFSGAWITKESYDEIGPDVANVYRIQY